MRDYVHVHVSKACKLRCCDITGDGYHFAAVLFVYHMFNMFDYMYP